MARVDQRHLTRVVERGVRDRLVHDEGAAHVGQLDRVHLSLAQWTVLILQQPGPDAGRVEQMIYVTG